MKEILNKSGFREMLRTKFETFLGIVLLCLSAVTSLLLPVFGYFFFKAGDRKKLHKHQELSARKQYEREIQFKKLESKFPLNGKRQKILKLSAQELVEGLQSRKLSSVEVLESYIAKALEVTKKVNCVIEFLPEALKWAEELDNLEDVRGPLHGIPVSIKEHCNIVGSDSTAGFAQFLFQPAVEDAVMVKALKALGAIPFCKTNVPQCLFTYGCGNSIYGETMNPLNTRLSPGGSSGGCAALVAGGGSVLSLGTDVGGSIRIPAHFCGVYGMKPTSGRMTSTGFRHLGLVATPISPTNGFLANSPYMLNYAYKELYSSGILHLLDPNAVPIPWNDMLFSTRRDKLRFGYYTHNPYFPPLGDTEKVVLEAVAKLRANGHEVVEFEMPDIYKIMDTFFSCTNADLGEALCDVWKGEAVSDSAITVYWLARLPMKLKIILAFMLEKKIGPIKMPVFHSPRFAKILRAGSTSWKTKGLWKTVVDRKLLLEDVKRKWISSKIDVLLSPVFPFPAVPYMMPGRILQGVAYTVPWNLLDFPAGVVRFGKESGKSLRKYNHSDDFVLRMAQKATKESIGMPIAVQIVGLPFQEEMVLNAMSVVDALRED